MGNFFRVVMVGLLVGISCVVFAEEQKAGMMDKGMMPPGMMMGEENAQGPGEMAAQGKMADMMPMCMMMKSMMMQPSLVATTDGGVIVLVGNKLQKYDKNLELKKEVEIKPERGPMSPMMMQKMGGCPGKKGLMESK